MKDEKTTLDNSTQDESTLDNRFDEALNNSLNESRGFVADRERTLLAEEKANAIKALEEKTETTEVGTTEVETTEVEKKVEAIESKEAVIETKSKEQTQEEIRIDPESLTEEESEELAKKLFPKYQSKKEKESVELKKKIAEYENRLANSGVKADVNSLIKPIVPIESPSDDGEIPPMPTDEEYETNKFEAMKKFYKRERFIERKEQREIDRKNAIKQQEIQAKENLDIWQRQYQDSFNATIELYPDAKNPDSPLAKKASEILARDHRRKGLSEKNAHLIPIIISPFADSDAIKLAAYELGISPKGKEVKTTPKPIYVLGRTGSGKVVEKKEETDDDLAKMSTYDLGQQFKKEAGLT